jgi:Asp-tRNA(Asn)/Glu-tRNA(Gln) amidotransferase A subunit family amidase
LKQKELKDKIDAVPPSYFVATTPQDRSIYALSLAQLASQCKTGVLSPSDVIQTYSKRAIRAHQATNCLSDIMFQEALTTPALADCKPNVESDLSPAARPLMGVPISIKGTYSEHRELAMYIKVIIVLTTDTIDIAGHDSTIGFSCNVGKPVKESSPLVRLLQDAGALIHAKTAVPTALLALETESDVFGRTTNPYNPNHTSGASSGGGAALVASGGCKIDIGSDVAGSVRTPAHFCGIWSLKGSAGRFPSWGNRSCFPGCETVSLIVGPMANSLDDLTEFWKRVIEMKPWQYDHTVCRPGVFTKNWVKFDVLDLSVCLSHGGRSICKQRKNG